MDDIDLTESRQGDLRSLIIAMLTLSTIIIGIRFWSRYLSQSFPVTRISDRFWWDDWTALAAALLNVAVCGIGLRLVDLGLGLHIQVVPPGNLEPFLKLIWVEYFLFDASTAAAKASALFFYARVFGEINNSFKYALWGVHVANIAWLLGSFLGTILQCSPVEKAWKPMLDGTCGNTTTLWLASGYLTLLIYIIILMMPLPMLWRLQMKTVRKIQVTIVFLCGYMVVVVTTGRLISITQAGSSVQLDPTWKLTPPILWLGSEPSISVVSLGLPSLLFLVQRGFRDGAWALITPGVTGSSRKFTNVPGSRSRLTVVHSHPYLRNDHNLESGNPSLEIPPGKIPLEPCTTSHVVTIGRTCEAEFSPDTQHMAPAAGIQVRNDIIIS